MAGRPVVYPSPNTGPLIVMETTLDSVLERLNQLAELGSNMRGRFRIVLDPTEALFSNNVAIPEL